MIPFLLFGLTTGEAVEPPALAPSQNVGGWLSLDDHQRGREEYIRRQRISMRILPPDEVEPIATIAVAVAAKRQVRQVLTQAQRAADLERELQARNMQWRDDYMNELYAELYRLDTVRRTDDLIIAMLVE